MMLMMMLQNRLATFFESLGWRVFRVAETATILLNGGVRKMFDLYCVRLHMNIYLRLALPC